jgi:hypothetical protein
LLFSAGKNATFEVKVLDVKTRSLPAWDDNLANTVREGMTLQALEAEVGCYVCFIFFLYFYELFRFSVVVMFLIYVRRHHGLWLSAFPDPL